MSDCLKITEVVVNSAVACGTCWAAWAASRAAKAAQETLSRQEDEARVRLWRSLAEEWDYKMVETRLRCMGAYKNGRVGEVFTNVMKFFEDLGYMVREGLVRKEQAKHTFLYYFAGYYEISKEFIAEDNKKDQSVWNDVLYLRNLWAKDPLIADFKEGLNEFIADELSLDDPFKG